MLGYNSREAGKNARGASMGRLGTAYPQQRVRRKPRVSQPQPQPRHTQHVRHQFKSNSKNTAVPPNLNTIDGKTVASHYQTRNFPSGISNAPPSLQSVNAREPFEVLPPLPSSLKSTATHRKSADVSSTIQSQIAQWSKRRQQKNNESNNVYVEKDSTSTGSPVVSSYESFSTPTPPLTVIPSPSSQPLPQSSPLPPPLPPQPQQSQPIKLASTSRPPRRLLGSHPPPPHSTAQIPRQPVRQPVPIIEETSDVPVISRIPTPQLSNISIHREQQASVSEQKLLSLTHTVSELQNYISTLQSDFKLMSKELKTSQHEHHQLYMKHQKLEEQSEGFKITIQAQQNLIDSYNKNQQEAETNQITEKQIVDTVQTEIERFKNSLRSSLNTIYDSTLWSYATILKDAKVYASADAKSNILWQLDVGERVIVSYPMIDSNDIIWMQVRSVSSDGQFYSGWVKVHDKNQKEVFVGEFSL